MRFVRVHSGWFHIGLAAGVRLDNLFLFNGTEVLIGLIYDGAACCLFDGDEPCPPPVARAAPGIHRRSLRGAGDRSH
jgi:hypothetical protein